MLPAAAAAAALVAARSSEVAFGGIELQKLAAAAAVPQLPYSCSSNAVLDENQ